LVKIGQRVSDKIFKMFITRDKLNDMEQQMSGMGTFRKVIANGRFLAVPKGFISILFVGFILSVVLYRFCEE
jgi:hypothetical protein